MPSTTAPSTAAPSTARLSLSAALAVVALLMSACGGGGGGAGNASGLATLADETATAADGGDAARAQLADPAAAPEPAAALETAAAPEPAAALETAAAPDPAAAASELDSMTDEERLLEFAQCMRDNGVDFPDPVIEADGTVAFGRRPGRGRGQGLADIGRDPDLPTAREACADLLQGLPFGPGGNRDFDDAELQDSLLEFARCMRDNGIDIADPDFSGSGSDTDGDGPPPSPFAGMGRILGASGADREEADKAMEICRERLVAFGRFGGPGGGGAGRGGAGG